MDPATGPVVAEGAPQREPQGPQSPVAVIGPDGKPVYVRPSDAIGKSPASSREQGRPVTSGDAGRIAEFDTSLDDLKVLRSVVFPDADLAKGDTTTTQATGTVAKVQAAIPNWATELLGGWGSGA